MEKSELGGVDCTIPGIPQRLELRSFWFSIYPFPTVPHWLTLWVQMDIDIKPRLLTSHQEPVHSSRSQRNGRRDSGTSRRYPPQDCFVETAEGRWEACVHPVGVTSFSVSLLLQYLFREDGVCSGWSGHGLQCLFRMTPKPRVCRIHFPAPHWALRAA